MCVWPPSVCREGGGVTDDQLLTAAELSALIKVKEETLERWRMRGQGPPYIKLGKLVRYARADIAEWVQAGRVTSD